MSLSPQSRIGPYDVIGRIGGGGMGEVYRARDRNLGRDVAMKVLPAGFTADPERMARFQREAQLLAALNHPHIAAIYGIEETKNTRALIMELVEGPTLSDRIASGPVSIEECLRIAKQVAEALEYAHEKAIVHRDLKPSNVKLTVDGNVKVLDFGLAKALADDSVAGDISSSQTLTLTATRGGSIIGTAAYMAPEQAHGRPVDRRADIWSFGVLLYEMLAAQPAFTGESVSDTLASVLKLDPNWNALPAATPPSIRKLLRQCLTKDRRHRLQAIGDARIAIEEYLANPSSETITDAAVQAAPQRWVRLPWVVAGGLAVLLILAAAAWWRATRPVRQPLVRLSVDMGSAAVLNSGVDLHEIISPDGGRIVYSTRGSDGKIRLGSRALDQTQPTVLAGTENAVDPFFSPDGQWVGFFVDQKLKKILVQGGGAVTICEAPSPRGASWGDDGNIIAALGVTDGLSRVSSAGGTPQPVTALDQQKRERSHRYPQVLPGSNAVIFVAGPTASNYEEASIEAQSLRTGRRKTLQRGAYFGRYVPSGHLLYMHQGVLFAAPMDPDRLELTGPAVPILEDVLGHPSHGTAEFDFSRTGTLVYVSGKESAENRQLLWFDSSGKTQPLLSRPGTYLDPRFSPDGNRIALDITEGAKVDVWVYEWARDTLTRLTFAQGLNSLPAWTPDGRRIAFRSTGNRGLFWVRADGAGEVQRLTESKNFQVPTSFSPDGKRLAFAEQSADTSVDLWTLPLEGNDAENLTPGKPEVFLRTPALETDPVFSPDGRWLAYASNESGNFEVYVRPFPGPGGKWQISIGGGRFPMWSRHGQELFYRTIDNRIMVSTYKPRGDSFAADKPAVWSEKRFTDTNMFRNFDLAPDGKRFAVLMRSDKAEETVTAHLTFLLNFFDELQRRALSGGR